MPKQNSLLLYLSVKTVANASMDKQKNHSNAKVQITSANPVIFN